MTFPSQPTRSQPGRDQPGRDQRGAVLPSPVVLLSIVAVALAAVAFVTTRDDAPAERDVSATTAAATPSPTATSEGAPAADQTTAPPSEKPKKKKPQVKRGAHAVVVFNNTSTTGLAGRVAETVTKAGWKLAATDNWYGTVPATTVYYPQGKKAAGQLLALDLGVARVQPAERGSDMSSTNLTLILTGPLD